MTSPGWSDVSAANVAQPWVGYEGITDGCRRVCAADFSVLLTAVPRRSWYDGRNEFAERREDRYLTGRWRWSTSFETEC
jgi:hypothetical protein